VRTVNVIRSAVFSIPGLGPPIWRLLHAILAQRRLKKISDSRAYWEKRYREGGTSGSGSYNRLAAWKAQVLNDFVRKRDVETVLELGSGDGAQLELADYPDYVGADVAPTAVEMCRRRFADDPTKRFFLADQLPDDLRTDLTLSLDVVYHLVEDAVFERHMTDLFQRSDRYVVVYSSNQDGNAPARHVKHREFTAWVDRHQPDWKLIQKVDNPYPYDPARPESTTFADFYVFEKIGS
jgi:hypothetical protein